MMRVMVRNDDDQGARRHIGAGELLTPGDNQRTRKSEGRDVGQFLVDPVAVIDVVPVGATGRVQCLFTSVGEAFGWATLYNAAAPATCGPAIEVPEMVL